MTRRPSSKLCPHCLLAPVRCGDRCATCYQYRRLNGVERPVELIAETVERQIPTAVAIVRPWREGRIEQAYRERAERLRRERTR